MLTTTHNSGCSGRKCNNVTRVHWEVCVRMYLEGMTEERMRPIDGSGNGCQVEAAAQDIWQGKQLEIEDQFQIQYDSNWGEIQK